MTIDERLDKLTERHEALTQTAELIAHMQQKNEEAHKKTESLMARLVKSIGDLTSIVRGHEQRITRLEDGQT